MLLSTLSYVRTSRTNSRSRLAARLEDELMMQGLELIGNIDSFVSPPALPFLPQLLLPQLLLLFCAQFFRQVGQCCRG